MKIRFSIFNNNTNSNHNNNHNTTATIIISYLNMRSYGLGVGCMARCDPCRSRSSLLSPPRRCTPPRRTPTVNASAVAVAPWRAPWSRSAAHRTACLKSTGWWSWKSGPTSTCSRCLLRYSFSLHNSIEVLTESVCPLVFRYCFLQDWCVKIRLRLLSSFL